MLSTLWIRSKNIYASTVNRFGLSLFGVDTGWSCGDGFEVEFATGQVDHGTEVSHGPETTGAGLHVLDDAVQSFEDRVRVRTVEVVGEDVPPTGRRTLSPWTPACISRPSPWPHHFPPG